MRKLELNLDYDEIRARIEIDKDNHKPGEWAKLTGTSINVISNIHGKAGNQKPSLQYILMVARATGKPVEWYLYGTAAGPEREPGPDPDLLEIRQMLRAIEAKIELIARDRGKSRSGS